MRCHKCSNTTKVNKSKFLVPTSPQPNPQLAAAGVWGNVPCSPTGGHERTHRWMCATTVVVVVIVLLLLPLVVILLAVVYVCVPQRVGVLLWQASVFYCSMALCYSGCITTLPQLYCYFSIVARPSISSEPARVYYQAVEHTAYLGHLGMNGVNRTIVVTVTPWGWHRWTYTNSIYILQTQGLWRAPALSCNRKTLLAQSVNKSDFAG